MYFSDAEYQARWDATGRELERLNCSAALIWARGGAAYDRFGDVYYLTRHYCFSASFPDTGPATGRGLSAVIVRPGERPELICHNAPNATDIATDKVRSGPDLAGSIVDALSSRNGEKVALVGADVVPWKTFGHISAALPNITWLEADDLIHNLRMRKSPAELACMRKAGAVASAGLDSLMSTLMAGGSQAEAGSAAMATVMAMGGRIYQFQASHGRHLQAATPDPLVAFADERPHPGDFLRGYIYGPFFEGYGMDPVRSGVAGPRPDKEKIALLERGIAEHRAILDGVRTGMTVRELVDHADRICGVDATNEHEGFRLTSYGHGQGLYFERPELSRHMDDADLVLEPGMALSIESFVQHEHFGVLGWEQPFILMDGGIEELVSTRYEWWH